MLKIYFLGWFRTILPKNSVKTTSLHLNSQIELKSVMSDEKVIQFLCELFAETFFSFSEADSNYTVRIKAQRINMPWFLSNRRSAPSCQAAMESSQREGAVRAIRHDGGRRIPNICLNRRPNGSSDTGRGAVGEGRLCHPIRSIATHARFVDRPFRSRPIWIYNGIRFYGSAPILRFVLLRPEGR